MTTRGKRKRTQPIGPDFRLRALVTLAAAACGVDSRSVGLNPEQPATASNSGTPPNGAAGSPSSPNGATDIVSVGTLNPGGANPGGDNSGTTSTAGSLDGGYALTVVRSGAGTGTVKSSTPGIDCGGTCTGAFTGTVILRARTQNVLGSFFTGWSSTDPQADCNGPKIDCTVVMDHAQTVTATFAPMDHNLIFGSSKAYPPDLGGLPAYDAACNTLATTVGINNASGDAYIAAMSDAADATNPVGNILTRLGSARGWVRPDGLAVADAPASLFGLTPYYPPGLTEQGLPLVGSASYTGFDPDNNGDDHCGRWTAARGTVAGGYARSNHWAGDGFGHISCSSELTIFCMGTTRQTPLGSVPAVSGKRIWITSTPYVPGSTTPNEKCQSELAQGASKAVAFVAYSYQPASAVIDPAATYVLADGRLVGTGAQLIAMDMAAGPWSRADGTLASDTFSFAWTGSSRNGGYGPPALSPATLDTTCQDWTSTDPSQEAFVGQPGASDWTSWEAAVVPGGQYPCSSPEVYLYCVEP